VDLFPDGMVRIVFLPTVDQRIASPVTVVDLDAAEKLFIMCGLMPGEAAALRGTVMRNKVASMDVSVDEEAAAKFWYKRP